MGSGLGWVGVEGEGCREGKGFGAGFEGQRGLEGEGGEGGEGAQYCCREGLGIRRFGFDRGSGLDLAAQQLFFAHSLR